MESYKMGKSTFWCDIPHDKVKPVYKRTKIKKIRAKENSKLSCTTSENNRKRTKLKRRKKKRSTHGYLVIFIPNDEQV